LPDVKTIQDEIRARLVVVERLIEPLRAEADQLSKLARIFDGPSAEPSTTAVVPARSRARTARTTRTGVKPTPPGKPRAKGGRPTGGGNRARQAVEQITMQPGITASELATAMGIAPTYLYRVLPRLQRDGKITKREKGYHAAGAGAGA